MAVVGLGGYAAQHHRAFERLEAEGRCRVVATCDPVLDSPRVPTYRSLEEMLSRHADELDVVTLPIPLPLHAAMHRAVVEAGIACYLEKPPTLSLPEFEEMRAVETQAVRPTQVGFNFVGDPFRQALRARIVAGEFGQLTSASLLAVWPRDAAYYGRAPWAGRLELNGRPVFDNPLGNAMAHHVQNLLFLTGTEAITKVRADLFRAHPIESFDTGFISATTSTGVELRLAATHSDDGHSFDRETFHFEDAILVFPAWNRAEIHRGGSVESLTSAIPDQGAMLEHNLAAYLEGKVSTSLSACAPFVSLFDQTFRSAPITPFPESRVTRRDGRVHVAGLLEELERRVELGTNFAPPTSLNS